jgi:hypothetical protein
MESKKSVVPDYMNEDVLPGETVCHTSDESHAHIKAAITGTSGSFGPGVTLWHALGSVL